MSSQSLQTRVGQIIDERYQIIREIAVGGMGTVYEAKHVKIGRTVALKILHPEMAADAEAVARFINEARIVGTMGHPNIVASTDFGELKGHLPYIVLEYLSGRTLAHEIETAGPFPVRRALRIIQQVAFALEAAHAKGVVHRDLTSGNIFLADVDGSPDHVKVLDFGISKFLTVATGGPKTRRGITMGTPEYMAPEQITQPDAVDARVDVYAVGVLLHAMLAGQVPFSRTPMQALLTQIVMEPHPPIGRDDVPEWIQFIVDRALAKDPADRFPTMRALRDELEQFGSLIVAGSYSGRVEAPTTGTHRLSTITQSGSRPRSSFALRTPTPGPMPRLTGVQTVAPPPQAPPANGKRNLLIMGAAVFAAGATSLAVVSLKKGPAPVAAPVAPIAAPASPAPADEGPPVQLDITSSTPHARVSLRGKTHTLPFHEEVKRDSKVEIVELTAPGHEGRRYWLTLDRPVHLAADLPAGRGLMEASAEETSVALGETDAPAAEAAEPETTTGERRVGAVGHRPSNKKDKKAPSAPAGASHGAATTASAEAGDPSPGVAPPHAQASAEPTSATTTPPSVAAGHAPAPADEPSVAPKPPEPPKPTVAVTPAPAPAVAAAQVARPAQGSLDSSQVQQVEREHAADIRRCHQRGKLENSDLHGKVTLKLTVSPSGQVVSSTVDASNVHNRTTESCLAAAAATWHFPSPGAGPVTLTHVFLLR